MSTPRRRSSSASSTPAKHNGKVSTSPAVPPQAPAPRPAADDRDAWKAYWAAQGQPWRTEPEIDQKRQKELDQCRAIVPDVENGIYPFKGMKLNRADVEWLLATHENGRGPVDWSDESQRHRKGLDLRGANLSHENLESLPLTCMLGGLTAVEWFVATAEQRNMAAACMERANLREAQLQGAHLFRTQLKGADLSKAHLQGSDLGGARLQGADLNKAHLQGASLREAQLQRAFLYKTQLQGANFREAQLDGVRLKKAILSDKNDGPVILADIRWGEVNLAVIDWAPVKVLGDEYQAYQTKALDDFRAAVRANRQLAVVLQNQGLNEQASRFACRAQILQRKIFWRERAIGKWLFSMLLALLAGYGYRAGRSFLAYLLVISGFATVYYILGHTIGPVLSPLGAFVFSMTSFHGRGFFPGNNISLDDPLTVLAALEALVGLIIEVTFIATLTQRFFNR